ncbi:MAG: TonB-dependent receptor [Candidatus Eisenbacteria bacterium]|nr:TonB-dependent receptor [Candidatus Eisenbacteria bacterium]
MRSSVNGHGWIRVRCIFVLAGLALLGWMMATQVWAETTDAMAEHAASSAAASEVTAPDVEPTLTEFVRAEYPERELRDGVEGEVLLQLLVTESGAVDSVWVVEGLTPALDEAAQVAALQFQFSPAMVGGEPVPVYVQFAYQFSLMEEAEQIGDVVNFRGRLRERGTRVPVTGALVVARIDEPEPLSLPLDVYLDRIGSMPGQFVEENRVSVYTDSTGTFEFRSLPSGRIHVTSPNSGYEAFESPETITSGERLEATYWLTRSHYDAYEVVVYGKDEEREVTRQSLSTREVERLPGFGGDVVKTVQALPSVARPSLDNPGAVIVRGSGNYDTRFFLDGVDIPLLFHFGGIKSTYNSLSLGGIDLYPGGYGARFGGAIGGIVELQSRPTRSDRWKRVVDASLLDASFHAEGPINKDWGLMVTGRRSFVGEIAKAALSSVPDIDISVAPYYWDGVVRVDRRMRNGGQLFLTGFVSGDRTEIIVPGERIGSPEVDEAVDAIETETVFSRFILGWDQALGSRTRNSLRAAAGHDRNDGHFFGEFSYSVRSPYYQIRDELTHRFGDKVTGAIGVDMVWTPVEYRVTASGWPTTKQNTAFSDLGAYTTWTYRPTDRLVLTPGLRFDYYEQLDEGALGERLAARYGLGGGHTLTASVGTYNQSPQPIGQSTDPVYGNPELPSTKALHTTLGDEWTLDGQRSLEVEAYYNRQWDVPVMTDSLDLNFLSDAEARMYGVEVSLRQQSTGRFFGWLSYSISRSERKFERRPQESEYQEMADAGSPWNPNEWVPYAFDQTHHFEAVGSWDWGNNISTGFRMQYVTGNPITPYRKGEVRYDADTGEYLPVLGQYFSDRMDPFFRVDVRVDKKFIRQNSIWSVYLDFQNANYPIYNAPEGYTYNYDYSKRKSYGWIPMPSLGVRAEF